MTFNIVYKPVSVIRATRPPPEPPLPGNAERRQEDTMLSQSSISSKGRAAGWARKFLGGTCREQPGRPGREENAGDVPRPRNPGDAPGGR